MNDWQLMQGASPEASVFQIIDGGEGVAWAATSAGLLRGQGEAWQPVPGMTGFPVWAVHAAGKRLVASGPTGLVYSVDGGRNWHASIVEQTRAQITCLAGSPHSAADGVLLAGTDGDGILRTHDGGRRWELCNFGLRSFNILALAAAPRWGRKEPVLVGAQGGLYYSPNGGRAWLAGQAASLDGEVVQAAAYLSNPVAFAALESGGLLRSLDGGVEWHMLNLPMAEDEAVSALLALPDGGLLAAVGARLLRSANSGDSWEALADAPAPIFCLASLAGLPGRPVAGCVEAGVFLLNALL